MCFQSSHSHLTDKLKSCNLNDYEGHQGISKYWVPFKHALIILSPPPIKSKCLYPVHYKTDVISSGTMYILNIAYMDTEVAV